MESKKDVFKILSAIDCKNFTETKNGLKYLSWAHAWGITKQNFADANYRVITFDGKPYLFDENLGYLVQTEVTIQGETMPMQLPVMDGANKAQKSKTYTYKVKEYVNKQWTGKYIDKEVEPATMFDINTAIMRCLTKNLAMFGLGHYIYAGEDIPVIVETEESKHNKMMVENENILKQANTFTNYDLYKEWYKVNVNKVTDEKIKSQLAVIGKDLKEKQEKNNN